MPEKKEWALLLGRVKDRKCTPFHESGVFSEETPVSSRIVRELVKKYNFPVEDHYCNPDIQVHCFNCLEHTWN